MRSLDQMIEGMHKHARATLIGNATERLVPFFHIQFKDRENYVMPAPWRNEREKSAFIHAAKAALRQQRSNIVNYAFVGEAWTAQYDHRPGKDDLTPSQRETRKECVIVSAGDHDKARMKMWEIIRDDQGRVLDLAEVEDKSGPFEGRLYNLLAED